MGTCEVIIDKQKVYYNRSKALSYNAYITICMGARGVGKTFDYKKWALTREPNTVWLRRYDEDVKSMVRGNKYLSDLYAENVIKPEEEIECDEYNVLKGGLPKVHFASLSTSARKKSMSYADCDVIIFDEFLEKNKRYLKDELSLFYDFVETVSRLRCEEIGKKDIRIIMIANKVSFVNPYFQAWGITPFTETYKTFMNGLILVENYKNELFTELKKKTNFGKLVSGTDYGSYAIDNEVWEDTNAMIEKKSKDATLRFNIRYKETMIGIWVDNATSMLYCSSKFNNEYITYTSMFDVRDGERPIINKKYPVKDLLLYYEHKLMRFENNMIKYAMFVILQNGGNFE